MEFNFPSSDPRELMRSLSRTASEVLESASSHDNAANEPAARNDDLTENELLERAIQLSLMAVEEDNVETSYAESKADKDKDEDRNGGDAKSLPSVPLTRSSDAPPRALVRSNRSIVMKPLLSVAGPSIQDFSKPDSSSGHQRGSHENLPPANLAEETHTYSWGWGRGGHLLRQGCAQTAPFLSATPIRVPRFDAPTIVDIVGSSNSIFAITANGQAYAAGSSDEGQLLLEFGFKRGIVEVPHLVESLHHVRIVQVACGTTHTIALTDNATALSFGSNEFGELGRDIVKSSVSKRRTNSSHLNPVGKMAFARKPGSTETSSADHFVICAVAAGRNFTITLTTSGEVFACGRGSYGALGSGTTANMGLLTHVSGLAALPIKQISAGCDHCVAITISGRAFAWGRNQCCQLGRPNGTPMAVKSIDHYGDKGQKVNTNSVVSSDSVVGMFSLTPILMETGMAVSHSASHSQSSRSHLPIESSSCGDAHTILVVEGGSILLGCGRNDVGQLGAAQIASGTENKDKDTLVERLTMFPLPREVVGLPDGILISQASCGANHTLVLDGNEGNVYAFGENRSGQLGRKIDLGGSMSLPVETPERVSLPRGGRVLRIAAVADASYAIMSEALAQAGTIQPSSVEATQETGALSVDSSSQSIQPPRTLRTRTPSMHPRKLSSDLQHLSVAKFLSLCDSIRYLAETSPSDRSGMISLCESGLQVFRSAAALNASFYQVARKKVLAIATTGNGQADATRGSPGPTQTSRNSKDGPPTQVRTVSATAIRLHSFSHTFHSASGYNGRSQSLPAHASSLDIYQIQRASSYLFSILLQVSNFTPAMGALDEFMLKAITSSISQIEKVAPQLRSEEQLRAVLVLLVTTLIWSGAEAKRRSSIQKKWKVQVSRLWLSLGRISENALCIIVQWILTLPPVPTSDNVGVPKPPQGRELIEKMVSFLDSELHEHLKAGKSPDKNSNVFIIAQVLQQIHKISSSIDLSGHNGERDSTSRTAVKALLEVKLSASAPGGKSQSHHDDSIFYSNVASKYSPQHLVNQYALYAREKSGLGNAGFSVCKFPFLLRPEVKRKLMDIESHLQMQQMFQAANQSAFASLFSGNPHQRESPFLGIKVRRSHLVEDSISVARKLSSTQQGARDLKKKLKVSFVGEAGVDAGGVTKEYFQLLTQEIMGPKFGMWIDVGDDATAGKWFNPASFESTDTYAMVGLLLGLGIYNGMSSFNCPSSWSHFLF